MVDINIIGIKPAPGDHKSRVGAIPSEASLLVYLLLKYRVFIFYRPIYLAKTRVIYFNKAEEAIWTPNFCRDFIKENPLSSVMKTYCLSFQLFLPSLPKNYLDES